MLDQYYIQQRREFNRDSSENRRRDERRSVERRVEYRRQRARRIGAAGDDAVQLDNERRMEDRRQLLRREGERRALDRRVGERRDLRSRSRGFPGPDGFLTPEERDFLLSMLASDK